MPIGYQTSAFTATNLLTRHHPHDNLFVQSKNDDDWIKTYLVRNCLRRMVELRWREGKKFLKKSTSSPASWLIHSGTTQHAMPHDQNEVIKNTHIRLVRHYSAKKKNDFMETCYLVLLLTSTFGIYQNRMGNNTKIINNTTTRFFLFILVQIPPSSSSKQNYKKKKYDNNDKKQPIYLFMHMISFPFGKLSFLNYLSTSTKKPQETMHVFLLLLFAIFSRHAQLNQWPRETEWMHVLNHFVLCYQKPLWYSLLLQSSHAHFLFQPVFFT